MNSWANKFHNRWFVRVDSRGIPVYGSLIDRPVKPRQGRWIEVTIPNQICCAIPSFSVTLEDTGFVLGGVIHFTIELPDGQILEVYTDNGANHTASLTALVNYLNTNYPGYGTFSVTGDVISVSTSIADVTLTAEYLNAIVTPLLDPGGFAAATNVTFTATNAIPTITTPKGATLAATITTIVGNLNTNYSFFGTWVALPTGIRLDNRVVMPEETTLTIALAYS